MRIRSILPKFWRSDDIDRLDWPTRLLFIGLWSYVDDNGVGRDRLGDIVGDLFAGDLSRDPRETFARVSEGLSLLAEGGQITRYEADGKGYLHIARWDDYQRVDKPNKARYPAPTCANAVPVTLAGSSRDSREDPAPGEGEKGRRGEGEKHSPSESEARKRAARATRLPDDFPVTPDMQAWAADNAPNAGPRDHDDFCDYWHAKAGKDATKINWKLTWQRWMRKASDERPQQRPQHLMPMERAAGVAEAAARLKARNEARQLRAIGD